MFRAACDASVFWQVEAGGYAFPDVEPFLRERHGIVRCGNTEGEAQRGPIARGIQLIQTDYPWCFAAPRPPAGTIPCDPSCRLFDPATGHGIAEPGNRIYVSSAGPVYRWLDLAPSATASLETVVSGGTISDDARYPEVAFVDGAAGGIRAESADGTEWLEVRRNLDAAGHGAIEVIVEAETATLGRIRRTVRSSAGKGAKIGELLRLTVEPDATVTAWSARRVVNDRPAYGTIYAQLFSRPMRRLGVSVSKGDVLFVRNRLNGEDLRLADLPGERAADPRFAVVDLSR
jgi:hypothetical protein